jgi:futalosine hydrolase
MKILLLSATQFEIQPFLQTVPKIDILISGVGVAASTYHLTKQLSHHHYDLVIQAGVAGTFNHELALGEVVTVSHDAFGDVGVMEDHFQSIQDMELTLEPEWLHNKNSLLQKLPQKQVKAITVNTIHTDEKLITALQQKWKAEIESMEGAVLHYVCQHQQTAYLQIRAISNRVGVRDKTQWKMKEAIIHLNEALLQLFKMLN